MNASSQPIGIFDSGIGGLSIWNEITSLMPKEHTVYLADSKNAPYGKKSKEEILNLCCKNTEVLLERNCKLIVVACNTATTNAIQQLRNAYNVPFIGIEPAIKPASIQTKTNSIGILATQGTLNSSLFEQTATEINQNVQIVEQVGTGLVELIESGKINSTEMTSLLTKHLEKLKKYSIDCLVLGCSHYPFLIPQIREILGSKIKIIDSGQAVARQTKNVLENKMLAQQNVAQPSYQFYSNNSTTLLNNFLEQNSIKQISYLDF
mgnify:CR=1 FL=1